MPNLGPTEFIFIGVVLLVLFGAKRLPELGAGLGKGIREFKKSVNEIKHDVSIDETTPQIRTPVRPQVTPGPSVPTQQNAEEITRTDV
jgi:sec-independent protein translocase protein TatA